MEVDRNFTDSGCNARKRAPLAFDQRDQKSQLADV